MNTPEDIIARLGLRPLTVEGGYFTETYRSTMILPDGIHCCGTSIYYLLAKNMRSDWHQVANDEIWFYHGGAPAIQLLIFPDGRCEERVIGNDITSGQTPQSAIPAGVWQAAKLLPDQADWGLFGAAVMPGFEYSDFTIGNAAELCLQFPPLAAKINDFEYC
jgi:predicted cupin superfamily sugar epimerase